MIRFRQGSMVLRRWPRRAAGVAALALAASVLAPTQLTPPANAGVLIITTVGSSIHNSKHTVVTQAAVGSTVHLRVSVTYGTSRPVPSGSVEVKLYFNGTCSGTAAQTTTAKVADGAVDVTASAYKTVNLDPISFRARYLGTTTYAADTGPCKVLTAVKATPTLSYKLHNDAHGVVAWQVPIGTRVHPLIVLTGSAGTVSGEVVARIWEGDGCGGSLLSSGLGEVSGQFDGGGISATRTTPGHAFIDGEYHSHNLGLYNNRAGPCVRVDWLATASLRTAVRDAAGKIVTDVKVGTDVRLTANLLGSYGPAGGTVRFKLWGGSTCSGTPSVDNTVQVDADGNASTQLIEMASAGTRAWQASFLGSDTYFAKTSPCLTFGVTSTTATPAPTSPPGSTAAPPTPPPATPVPATAGPNVTPGPGSTSTAATAAPGSSVSPSSGVVETLDPAASPDPGATGSATADPGNGAPNSAVPGSPGPAPSSEPAASVGNGDMGLLIVALFVVGIGLLVVGLVAGVALSRRSRART